MRYTEKNLRTSQEVAQRLANAIHEPYLVVKHQNRTHIEAQSFLQSAMGQRRYNGAQELFKALPEVEYLKGRANAQEGH